MRKLRVFGVEVVGVGLLLGWLMWKYPESSDVIVRWIGLLVALHITWEFILEPFKEQIKRATKSMPIEVKWIFVAVTTIGLSCFYYGEIGKGMDILAKYHADWEARQPKPGQQQFAQPPKQQSRRTLSPTDRLARSLMAERLSTSAKDIHDKLHEKARSLHGQIDSLASKRGNLTPDTYKRQQANMYENYRQDVIPEINQAKQCQSEALSLLSRTNDDQKATLLISTILSWGPNDAGANWEYSVMELAAYLDRLHNRLDVEAKF